MLLRVDNQMLVKNKSNFFVKHYNFMFKIFTFVALTENTLCLCKYRI